MKISGLQKLTLLDFPGHTACTVFTSGCNFRCPFCHNASLVNGTAESEISEEEFFAFLEKRKGILNGVAITGGEPTLQNGIYDFIEKICEKGFKVKLDTNGFMPQKLKELLSMGNISYVAMDIKSSPEGYAKACGIKDVDVDKISQSIELLKNGNIPYEFRTTAVKGIHVGSDFLSIGKWLGNVPGYYIQRFVDSGDVLESGFSAFSEEEMFSLLAFARGGIPNAKLRGI